MVPVAKPCTVSNSAFFLNDSANMRHRRVLTSNAQNHSRRGGAMVEFAVFLPLVLSLLLMSIEAANGIYMRQAATTAAYEGARVATATGGTQASAELRIKEILNARGITKYNVDVTPAINSSTLRGTEISMRVRVIEKDNRLPINFLFKGGYFESTIRMIRL
jgi:Flp pilus assembly protein TadG